MAPSFLVALFAATVIAAGQLSHAAPSTAEVFWRAALPNSPLPDAILRLLRPADTSFVNRVEGEGPFNYQDYKRSSGDDFGYDDYRKDSSKRAGGGSRAGDPPFNYAYQGSDKLPGAAVTRADDPPFNYAYEGSDKRPGAAAVSRELDYRKGSSKRAGAGDPPFNYAYEGSAKRPGAAAVSRDLDYDDYSGAEKRRGATSGEPPFQYAYKAQSKSQAGERRGATAGEPPFLYAYKAPSKTQGGSGASDAASKARGGGAAATTTVFFHEEAVRVGERLPFHFPPAATSALGLLPRRVADSIPFSMPALPGVLAKFGIAPDSAVAASMTETLRTCESPFLAGETKFCATSLETLVERAMATLGTRDVRALTSTLPRAGAPLQPYTVRAVWPIEGGPSFVACHDEAYPYTVYRCHTTGPSRAYMVEMDGARGGAVTVATVCHTDTSRWNPEHVSFKLLRTKPGGAPVCHLMPYGHIIWAKNVKLSPA